MSKLIVPINNKNVDRLVERAASLNFAISNGPEVALSESLPVNNFDKNTPVISICSLHFEKLSLIAAPSGILIITVRSIGANPIFQLFSLLVGVIVNSFETL